MTLYSDDDVETAPHGHVRFAQTDVDVVAYRINARDMCVLVNKGGVCVYRVTLLGALDAAPPPLIHFGSERFSICDLRAVMK